MASLIVRRNAARHILSAAKTPPSTPSLPTGIPTSCRFQSTTYGPTSPATTATTVPTVPRPSPYGSPTRPAYTPTTPRSTTTTPRSTTPATTPRPTTPAIPTSSTTPKPTTPGTSTNTTPTTPTTPTAPTTPRPAAPSYTPAPRENHAPTAANAFKAGLNDLPPIDLPEEGGVDWARSFSGLSEEPFAEDIRTTLMAPLNHTDIEIKPDGIIYLPEIKYRRILNKAFGPGGWGLAPRSDTIITNNSVTREYGLVCHGRLVSISRGEQDYFDPSGIPTATEGCKSNAMMRCCKDLGIASELWDPRFIRKFKKEMCSEIMAEHMMTKKKKKVWVRKGDMVEYPFKQV